MRATIAAVCLSRKKGGPKLAVERAELVADHGLRDDAHAGLGRRQVSLLAEERIAAMRASGLELQPGAFGENLITRGFDLGTLHPGDRVRVGDRVELEVTQRGKQCHEPCAIYHQVGMCIMPTEGVFARVLRGGSVAAGDAIERMAAESF